MKPGALLAGVHQDEAQCDSAEDDEDSRRQRVTNGILQLERLQDEGQNDAQGNDEDPEDGCIGTAEKERRGLLMDGGRCEMADPAQAEDAKFDGERSEERRGGKD